VGFSPKALRNEMDAATLVRLSVAQTQFELAALTQAGKLKQSRPPQAHLIARHVVAEYASKLGGLNENQIKGNATNILLRLKGRGFLTKERGVGNRFVYALSSTVHPYTLAAIKKLSKMHELISTWVLSPHPTAQYVLPQKTRQKLEARYGLAVNGPASQIRLIAIQTAAHMNLYIAQRMAADLRAGYKGVVDVNDTHSAPAMKPVAGVKVAAKPTKAPPAKKTPTVPKAKAKIDLPDFL